MPTTLDTAALPETDHESNPRPPHRSTIVEWHYPAVRTPSDSTRSRDVGRHVTPAVAGLLTLTLVAVLTVGASGWVDVSPFPVIASGVLVLFAGLFARVRVGGGRRLPLAGALLLPVLALSATAAPHLDDGVGDRRHQPSSFDDVEAEYRFGIGNLDVDLRGVEFPPGEHTITIDHGIGAARVRLPGGVSVSASGHVDVGALDLIGESGDGVNVTADTGIDGTGIDGTEIGDPGTATIILEFDTSIGYATVEVDPS